MSKDNDEVLNRQQQRNKPKRTKKLLNPTKVLIALSFAFYIILQIFSAYQDTKPTSGVLTLTELYELVESGETTKVIVTKSSNKVTVIMDDGTEYDSVNPQNDTFIYDLMDKGANVQIQKSTMFESLLTLALALPATVIMMMFIVYLSNTIVGGSTKMFSLLKTSSNDVTFDDIKGLGDTKKEVQFIVEQFNNWKELGALGARPCKGALLYGPPGTGKTMLARAIAKEAGVSFISASGSDFNEVFVGVGAARVRSLWDLASNNAPCILFIDEIDCLGKRRKGGDGASQDHNQTLNALLQKMDGLNKANGIMVIGATNRKDDLDPALLRPGRFDRHYFVGPPDSKKDRDEVVEIYLKNKKLADEVTLEKASKLMVGLTGAEIEAALNEAVYISLQEQRKGVIKLSDIDEAVMNLRCGGVKKEHTSSRDLEVTALHEAGHTIVSLLLGYEINKVSIVPYSSGLGGVTIRDTDKTGDIKLKLLSEFKNDIKILLAGMVAEELKYGEHTFGCCNDLEKATELIHQMVTRFGLNQDKLSNLNVLIEQGVKFGLPDEITDICNKYLSELTEEVKEILGDNKERLCKLSDMLLRDKTLVCVTLEQIDKETKPIEFIDEDK